MSDKRGSDVHFTMTHPVGQTRMWNSFLFKYHWFPTGISLSNTFRWIKLWWQHLVALCYTDLESMADKFKLKRSGFILLRDSSVWDHVHLEPVSMHSNLTRLPPIISLTGNGLPLWHPPDSAGTASWPGHHGRTRMAVSLQGGPLLCGNCGVHLLPPCGACILIKSPGNRPFPLWTTWSPRWSGGGHSAPNLCHQYQPANSARKRTLFQCDNLKGSHMELTVVGGSLCHYRLFDGLVLVLYLLPVDSWISEQSKVCSWSGSHTASELLGLWTSGLFVECLQSFCKCDTKNSKLFSVLVQLWL